MTARDPWKTRAGKKLKAQVVAEEPTCRLHLDGCTGRSTTADHIIPRSLRPDLTLVRANCQGACLPCNIKRSNHPIEAIRPAQALTYFTKSVATQHD